MYILNDGELGRVYQSALKQIDDKDIDIICESYGIVLRFDISNPLMEYEELSLETIQKILKVQEFLAKIENPVIIEVHTGNVDPKVNIKNWEISTVIANNIGDYLLKRHQRLDYSRIKSVGYGEFKPIKNTPYNGGKYLNRVDIIVLCNISGE